MNFLKDRYVQGAVFLWIALFVFSALPPYRFPDDAIVSIRSGATINSVASDLHAQSIISSRTMFKALVLALAPDTGVVAGEYSFKSPASVVGVVRTVTDPTGGGHAIRLTIPEGLNNREIAEIARGALGDDFKIDEFLRAAARHEGYLFPETYFVPKSISAAELVSLMRHTFDERILDIAPTLASSAVPLHDLVIMASILEGEAYTKKTMRQVAGVLWHRIEIDMPLQVDAVFKYFLGRTTFDLTLEDLEHESPYNTYDNIGLPPSPINNPGLAAIESAATPIETDALFYLTGRDGNFYFAETFDEHKQNKFRYLR